MEANPQNTHSRLPASNPQPGFFQRSALTAGHRNATEFTWYYNVGFYTFSLLP